MRAAMCREWGPPEVVEIEDVPAPMLQAGQIRVDIHAASVNFPDVLLVAGEYQIKVPPPFIVGSEFAGPVTEVADDVTNLKVGDRVFGTAFVGAFAEQITVAALAVTRTPDTVDDASAAAFGVAHRTAYNSLRTPGAVQAGEEVIVLGAGGGVGLAAVQLAVALGASVTAVASSDEKLDVAKQYGATTLVNHRAGDLRQALKDALPGGADVVIDPVGGDLAEPALRSLRGGGRFVTVGFAAGTIPRIPLNLVLLKGIQIVGFEYRDFIARHGDELQRNDEELLGLLARREVLPHIGARFPLDDVVGALRCVGDGQAIGKVVVDLP
ncbi:MAG: NADPH:quinone oxidoreductase family protein [Actinobacteria bacterium]|nr:NADPH:quinone oxidoreductase family protein [Actinomycetota bacterium]MBV9255628.1 NADPH:quinone oxidoreductase family protein [Actinomycetota bacterium]MBV9936744.1 NADPH:quinone oxidoreductase family protein [Actinomycetota bacterium]